MARLGGSIARRYGDPLGPVQGVGYVNELLARLTGTPVADHTTHNATLPFPLDRALYADFTHEMLAACATTSFLKSAL